MSRNASVSARLVVGLAASGTAFLIAGVAIWVLSATRPGSDIPVALVASGAVGTVAILLGVALLAAAIEEGR